MRGNFTPAVGRALAAARSWAGQAGRFVVTPGDWLAALLLEDEGRAAVLLAAAGLDLAAYRAELALPAPAADPPELPLDRAAQAGVVAAYDVALDLDGESTISGAALALGLLRTAEPLRVALARHGLDYARLEASLAASKLPPIVPDEPLVLAPAGEEIDLARLLDAAANRAREALRVVEDHCRFVLDDAGLSRQCKELRHDLQAALATVPAELLLQARDTRSDVGTTISTPSERHRGSLREVLQANLKRLQEALRSLEEFGKMRNPEMGVNLERLRYRAYTLERVLLLGGTARARLEQVRLYALVSAAACTFSLRDTLTALAEGGVEMVQLREKGLSDRELLTRARQVRQWTRERGLLFIVNDRADVARLAEADGVHVGQDDLPVKEARRLVGTDAVVGVSTHNVEQVRAAVLDGADYLGVGPVFASRTKAFADLAGVAFVRAALAETTRPAFALGGIDLGTIGEVVAAGATRVAVSQALLASEAPAATARALRGFLPS